MLLTHLTVILITAFGIPCLALGSSGPDSEVADAVVVRQSPIKPHPCKALSPPPTKHETKKRFHCFANAFLLSKNLTKAFSYITKGYINHNPFADDGFDAAFDFLAPVWPTTNISLHRTLFRGNMGWLNYNASGVGEVIDRFRWENGCIVEHWDVGEVWPAGH
ncbi:hypothetical protein DER45DRAFT_590699 [Fusarium avenaceum]|nr:hypothetical protein DER45DRAFT_590699 [Fusarium avenaceum]